MGFDDKLDGIPQEVQTFFCSSGPRLSLEKACFSYDIKEDDMEKLTSSIAEIFFKDLKLAELPIRIMQNLQVGNSVAHGIAYELSKNMCALFPDYFRDAQQLLTEWEKLKCAPLVSEEKARRRLLDLEPWLEEEEREKAEEQRKVQKEEAEEIRKSEARFEKVAFLQALKKFPKLGEQNITVNMIKLKYFPTPVRPSIKNWVTDYQDFAGPGQHSAVERGNFIFHGENAKKLTPLEKQKVSFVLRMLDEDGEVKIDALAQTMVLEIEESPKQTNMQNFAQQGISQNVRQNNLINNFAPVQKAFPVEEDVKTTSEMRMEKGLARNFFSGVARKDVFQASVIKPTQTLSDFAAEPVSAQSVQKKTEAQPEPRFANMAPFGKTINPVMPTQPQKPAEQKIAQQKPFMQKPTEKEPVEQKPASAQNAPAAGKVSFSSPQNFTPPKKAPLIRSPYRITPRGYEYDKGQN